VVFPHRGEKQARTLAVADELFARDGVDVPMPVLAEAIGVGVGSIYRQVGNKNELIAALVIERAAILRARFLAALDAEDPWTALTVATHETVDDCIGDALSQTAWDEAAFASTEVRAARAEATEALARMVERARDAGATARRRLPRGPPPRLLRSARARRHRPRGRSPPGGAGAARHPSQLNAPTAPTASRPGRSGGRGCRPPCGSIRSVPHRRSRLRR
jgi:AcrR family transcriptional regulator